MQSSDTVEVLVTATSKVIDVSPHAPGVQVLLMVTPGPGGRLQLADGIVTGPVEQPSAVPSTDPPSLTIVLPTTWLEVHATSWHAPTASPVIGPSAPQSVSVIVTSSVTVPLLQIWRLKVADVASHARLVEVQVFSTVTLGGGGVLHVWVRTEVASGNTVAPSIAPVAVTVTVSSVLSPCVPV